MPQLEFCLNEVLSEEEQEDLFYEKLRNMAAWKRVRVHFAHDNKCQNHLKISAVVVDYKNPAGKYVGQGIKVRRNKVSLDVIVDTIQKLEPLAEGIFAERRKKKDEEENVYLMVKRLKMLKEGLDNPPSISFFHNGEGLCLTFSNLSEAKAEFLLQAYRKISNDRIIPK